MHVTRGGRGGGGGVSTEGRLWTTSVPGASAPLSILPGDAASYTALVWPARPKFVPW